MKKILNVGCGNHTYGTHFIDLYPQRKEVIKCNVEEEKFPFPDEFFDEVHSENIFEHLKNPNIVLNKMARVSLFDVLRGRNPNQEAIRKQAQKKMAAAKLKRETDRRRREISKADETRSMLKKGKRSGNADAAVKQVATKGGTYPVYKKKSETAQHFRDAFKAARKAGKKTFTWNGKKYNTKVK